MYVEHHNKELADIKQKVKRVNRLFKRDHQNKVLLMFLLLHHLNIL